MAHVGHDDDADVFDREGTSCTQLLPGEDVCEAMCHQKGNELKGDTGDPDGRI